LNEFELYLKPFESIQIILNFHWVLCRGPTHQTLSLSPDFPEAARCRPPVMTPRAHLIVMPPTPLRAEHHCRHLEPHASACAALWPSTPVQLALPSHGGLGQIQPTSCFLLYFFRNNLRVN
jgi:hypothetical protein